MHTPTPCIVAASFASITQVCPDGHAGRSGRPQAPEGVAVVSSHAPWMQRGSRSGAHVSVVPHCGLGGHMRLASNAAASLEATAVSVPPIVQPQQSARTRTQSPSLVQVRWETVAHVHSRQPVEASIANPSGQLSGHAVATHWIVH